MLIFGKKRMRFVLLHFWRLQKFGAVFYVLVDRLNKLVQGTKVFHFPQESQNGDLESFPVKVLLELVQDVGLHGLEGVVEIGVPSYAHYHLVDRTVVHRSQAVVDPRPNLIGKFAHDLVGKVGGGATELF